MNPLKRRNLLLAPWLVAPAWAAEEAVVEAVAAATFPTPEGKAFKLADWRGQPLLLNFWATWCAPCIKEMPELDRFHQEEAQKGAKGWRVVGLAIDGPTPVRDFLKRRPVGYPIGLAGLNGSDLMRKLGNLRGGLPFTVLLDSAGGVAWRRPGEISLTLLREQRAQWTGS